MELALSPHCFNSKMFRFFGILFLFLIASPLDANESKSTIKSARLFSATTDEHHHRIKRQFGFPFMQGALPFMGGGYPYMQGFYMPQTFPTFFSIGSRKRQFEQNFFGSRGKSKDFFMTLGR